MKVFIDSSIPMYAAGQEHPNREPSLRFLRRVQSTSTEVLQELLYRYSAIGRRDLSGQVYDPVRERVPGGVPHHSGRHGRGAGPDSGHAAVKRNQSVELIATFDQRFDLG